MLGDLLIDRDEIVIEMFLHGGCEASSCAVPLMRTRNNRWTCSIPSLLEGDDSFISSS
jgi:hypothetical protein